MKQMKRSGVFAASNVSFCPSTMEAHSYGWWCFVKRINGYVVFNQYRYSVSTSKHQYKVSRLLNELGIKVDLYINTVYGLDGRARWGQGIDAKSVGIEALKNAYRLQHFESVSKIERVFKVKMPQSEVKALYVSIEEDLCDAFLKRSIHRQEKIEREAFQAMHKKLENYLENEVCFRDYEIFHKEAFGDPDNKAASIIGVHQVVDVESMESDVENAIHNFLRDGFSQIVFYVGGVK